MNDSDVNFEDNSSSSGGGGVETGENGTVSFSLLRLHLIVCCLFWTVLEVLEVYLF